MNEAIQNIAVLITCYNRKEKTIKCLEKLFANEINIDKWLLKVFLVDDGSTDGTSEAISIQFPNVNILKGNGNLFWNRGMNLAWREASKINAKYFVWLNDDTYLFQNGINDLIEASIKKEDWAIIVGSTVSSKNQQITYGGRTQSGKLIVPNGNLQQCHHFNGNIVLIPQNIFQQLGFLDDAFHHAFGDFDYGLRANKKGISSFVSPSITGYCEQNIGYPNYFNPKISFFKRIKALYKSSSGVNPVQHFIFEKRHKGIFKAIFHFTTINVRALVPVLWPEIKNYK